MLATSFFVIVEDGQDFLGRPVFELVFCFSSVTGSRMYKIMATEPPMISLAKLGELSFSHLQLPINDSWGHMPKL